MDILVKSKYLVFPINTLGSHKHVSFLDGGHEVYGLNMRLDNLAPNYYAYIDVSRFMGKKLTLSVEHDMEISLREAECMDIPNLYHEPLRPQVHFTAKNGWINDPNGLIYINGEYHMFYQYNPADVMWENMHWGHAKSRDLVHWEELDIALFPDDNGAKFSGSAITDDNNILGLQKGENKTAIVYYTATKPFSQRMLVSTDNFKTLTEYMDRPAVPFLGHEERDPKVVFCEELDCYIMALYIKDSDYAMFKSNDLVNWERFFDYTLPGENEFPDILKFKDNSGITRYILTSNTDHYIVTSVKDGQFHIDEELKPLFWCSDNHAPLSFWGVPDGRCIRAIWVCYCSFLYSENFYGQLMVLEYTMEEKNGKCYLAANPVKEMESLYSVSSVHNDIMLTSTPWRIKLEDKPYVFKLKGAVKPDTVVKMKFFGRVITFDFTKNEIIFEWRYTRRCPITVVGNELDVTVLVDRGGFDIFADGGKSCMYCIGEKSIPDRNIPYIELYTDSGEYLIDKLEMYALDSIWENGKE